ncbi:MAG: hypothetical protein ACYTKD_04055 [Planctomycetota bacterium]|jgi:hypothetical protein
MLRLPSGAVTDSTAERMWGVCKALFVCEIAAVIVTSSWDTFGRYLPYVGSVRGPVPAGAAAVVVLLAAAAYLLTSSRRVLPRALVSGLVDRLEAGDRVGAMELCAWSRRPLARIAFEGLARAEEDGAFALAAVDAATFDEWLRARRCVNALAIVARVAPLAGMAGCVLQMPDILRRLTFGRGCSPTSPADAYLRGLCQIGAWFVVFLLAGTAARLLGPRVRRRVDEARAVARALVDHAASAPAGPFARVRWGARS